MLKIYEFTRENILKDSNGVPVKKIEGFEQVAIFDDKVISAKSVENYLIKSFTSYHKNEHILIITKEEYELLSKMIKDNYIPIDAL